jgi:26S proteasome regulatory subunit N13
LFCITGTVQSPQFQQALSLFSSAFQSGQLAPLIREFSLGEEAVTAATSGDMEAFVKALQEMKGAEGTGEKKDEGPEDMALD